MSRTNIELWIAGQKADLSDSSFILMNYTQEDLSSPAVVRNSFSKQITLPGTPRNNDIFGGIYRNDRVKIYHAVNQSGIYFDPNRKTEFRIYNDRSEVVESGYMRLNSIVRSGSSVIEYKVTLYGGLGSFLYGLMYDDQGEKRTLADLDYRGLASPAGEFDFTLNAANIRQAWSRLGLANHALSSSEMWDWINFVPAYNGLPGGTFDANKGILDVVRAGLSDGTGTVDGQALVSLPQEYTEWAVRDLRSYLQRPALRFRGFIEAIARSANNGGWTVNLDPTFFSTTNPHYNKVWMTLPIINTDNLVSGEAGGGDLTFQSIGGSQTEYEAYIGDFDEDRPYAVQMKCTPMCSMPDAAQGPQYLHCEQLNGALWINVWEYDLKGYDRNGNLVAQDIKRLSSRQVPDPEQDAPMDYIGTFTRGASSIVDFDGPDVQLAISATGIYRVTISLTTYKLYWNTSEIQSADMFWTNPANYSSNFYASTRYVTFPVTPTYTYNLIYGGRSNRPVTKAALLGGVSTPADYLLAYCKMFGLVIVADALAKVVDIMPRTAFYSGEVRDITDRVDVSSIEKEPFAYSARWYVWDAGYDSGEWAKKYKEKYGKAFGQMRVDTGFAFDANTTSVMSGSVLKGAVMALENSKYYCLLNDGGPLPSVFLDRGAKFTVVKSATQNEDIDIEKPSESAGITYLNAARPTYDLFPKVQLHDADDKAFDGSGVLLFFEGMANVPSARYVVTDDTAFMIAVNGGTPCWLLDWATRDSSALQQLLPMFSRYEEIAEQHQGYIYERSLDYGTPSEVPIPDATFQTGGTVYDAYWKKYIADRYDDDSAVIRCKVDLHGFRVNARLLRGFYWFDGAVWALNKIINHSVTTDDLTECEFVKVQDTNNYTT